VVRAPGEQVPAPLPGAPPQLNTFVQDAHAMEFRNESLPRSPAVPSARFSKVLREVIRVL